MSVRRIVPNIHAPSPETLAKSAEFYGLLGLEEVMNLGWITTFASPAEPLAQLSVFTHDETAPVVADVSIEVDDVDAVYEAVRASGAEIVHPLQNEPWGVRRFFTRDPNGQVLNILSHA
ncbi:glyoxalase [Sphaerisporangium siamense]|uniref:Putative enzyme related to lactoylglutathione lyase n=1 Tax=Sphaerisporangium siamense TaxID=795645 RepID=A0A7W7GEB0_9ACTN|nr:VOC family protein [Sphaerisporangium siamense]MBB4705895.1 putative enzyme related to lactoylglutathione lyase [Sphaerisporangium siamense]GII82711.1 glyoxalase [Sphaerisporangium siamense]